MRESKATLATGNRALRVWLNAAPLILLWIDFLLVFSKEWRLNPDYHYGFLTPIIAGYLLYLRWLDRPNPSHGARTSGVTIVFLGLLALLLPIRIVLEANPDWRAAQWAYALCICAATLTYAAFFGGRRWATHFAPALVIMLLAAPWPVNFEQWLVTGLMNFVAAFTVEALNLMGVFAERHGTIIRVASGLVGVEEACSGVRSLQSTLMASVFLGELFRFGAVGRIILIASGAVLSLALNVARTFSLTLTAIEQGPSFMENIHDPVGNVVAVLAFVILFTAAALARNARPRLKQRDRGAQPPMPMMQPWQPAAIAALILLQGSFVWLWFARNSGEGVIHTAAVDWSRVAENVQFAVIPPATRSILRYSDGVQAVWTPTDSKQCNAFFFTWDKGTISSFAGVHRPEVCLPSAGFQRVSEAEPVIFNRGGLDMRFDAHVFTDGVSPYYVFFSVWDTRQDAAAPLATDWSGRLKNALNGQRVLGRQSLQLVFEGGNSGIDGAKARLLEMLERSVTVQ